MTCIRVSRLTGFLGAAKRTPVNRLAQGLWGGDTAVLVAAVRDEALDERDTDHARDRASAATTRYAALSRRTCGSWSHPAEFHAGVE